MRKGMESNVGLETCPLPDLVAAALRCVDVMAKAGSLAKL